MKKIFFLAALIAVSACCVGNPDEYASLKWSENDGFPAWRGERKSFCAELSPLKDLNGVTVHVTDLKSECSKIDASDIKAQFVSCVMADVFDIEVKKNLPAAQVQPVWLGVAVPQDAAPGIYRGELKIKAEGGLRWSLPYELEVIDEILPEQAYDLADYDVLAGDSLIVCPDGRSSVRFERLIEGIQDYEKARIMMDKWYEAGNGEKLNQMYAALGSFTLSEFLKDAPQDALKAAKSLINPKPVVRTPGMNVIFDTDIGGDIDDVPALQMVLNYHKQGKINLKAVTLVKDHPKVVPFVDGYLRFNGVVDVPLGFCHNGTGHEDWYYLIPTLAAYNSRGEKLLRPQLEDVEEAYRVMRRVLVETEGKTTLVAVGYFTNLKRLILSEGDDISPDSGIELMKKKVDKVYVMGGMFREEGFLPEWNILSDLEAAKIVFGHCPVELVALGWEIGVMLLYPHQSVLTDFGKPEDHPLSVAYCNYAKMPYDRPCWDPATVYLAIEPEQDIYELSPAGTIRIDDEGYSLFTENPSGKHRYVKLSEADRQRALDEIVRVSASKSSLE